MEFCCFFFVKKEYKITEILVNGKSENMTIQFFFKKYQKKDKKLLPALNAHVFQYLTKSFLLLLLYFSITLCFVNFLMGR